MREKTQQEMIRDDELLAPKKAPDRLKLPGIETLHLRPTEELAEILANLLKARTGYTKVTYKLGEYIEFSFDKD